MLYNGHNLPKKRGVSFCGLSTPPLTNSLSSHTHIILNRTCILRSALVLLALALITGAEASPRHSKACFQEASTELEKLYCTIQLKGGGKTLPLFSEFKRNNHTTQRLLLKREARAFDLSLPEARAKNKKKPEDIKPSQFRSSAIHAPSTPKNSNNKIRTERRKSNGGIAIGSCLLERETIQCNNRQYVLQTNIPLKLLPHKVLGEENTLNLPKPNSNEAQGPDLVRYLSRVYPLYIEKMLALGLADSTMSFTKFHAIYQQSKTQKQSFSERFSAMYELLKKERRRQSIQARYRENFPNSIEQCMSLSTRGFGKTAPNVVSNKPTKTALIVCDNIHQNWIYR